MAASPAVPQPSILLVDDDAFMLDLQSRVLGALGYRSVTTSGSARSALDELQNGTRPADVIVCDLNMPGMDGVEFLQTLNAGPFCGSVILLSGEGARILHTVQKLLSGGRLTILGALEKPAPPQALRALLECWCPPGTRVAPSTLPLPISADEVRQAVRDGEWVLHYQPKVDLSNGTLTGMEALIRWHHPLHGLVYPDRFIGIAEDCGAIDDVTDWVLRDAVQQLRRWNSDGLPIQVAVNVSMNNLRAPGFAKHAAGVVRAAGMSPHSVTLEITESRAMSPSAAPLESLVRLRLERFKLSIDDFGTGHSSLAQLRDVPFTELKVDRGFVHGARNNQIIRPMLEGSIGIAKRLGMLSVAEGVETEQDWLLVRDLECDVAQGYFIGRPMPVAAVPAWLASWQLRRHELFGS